MAGTSASDRNSGRAGSPSGLTYFHNDLSNVIGFNGLFQTLNLGAAETQGLEAELRAQPITNLLFTASYTYLDAEKTDDSDISQPKGSRLPRRPRNEVYVSASYLWWKRLRTTLEAKFVNAREEINFGGPNFDIEDYSLREHRRGIRSESAPVDLRPDRQSDERTLLGSVRFSRARPCRVWRREGAVSSRSCHSERSRGIS